MIEKDKRFQVLKCKCGRWLNDIEAETFRSILYCRRCKLNVVFTRRDGGPVMRKHMKVLEKVGE